MLKSAEHPLITATVENQMEVSTQMKVSVGSSPDQPASDCARTLHQKAWDMPVWFF